MMQIQSNQIYCVPDESTAYLCNEDLASNKKMLMPAYWPPCPLSVEIEGQEDKKVKKVLGQARKNITFVG